MKVLYQGVLWEVVLALVYDNCRSPLVGGYGREALTEKYAKEAIKENHDSQTLGEIYYELIKAEEEI